MKYVVGYSLGVMSAAVGISIGLYFAWAGFSSEPHSGAGVGFFWGSMGCLVGGFFAVGALVAPLARRHSRRPPVR